MALTERLHATYGKHIAELEALVLKLQGRIEALEAENARRVKTPPTPTSRHRAASVPPRPPFDALGADLTSLAKPESPQELPTLLPFWR